MVRALLLALLCLSGPAHAQPAFRILYNLQSTEPSEDQSAALTDYLRAHPNAYFLVRSFACDTGGFRVSLKISEKRADRVRGILARESAPEHVRYALPAVIEGEPRVDHRRLEVHAFETPAAVDLALKQANEETARYHEAFADEIRQPETAAAGPEPESTNLWPLAILLSLVAALFLYFILTRARRKKDRHAITPELAEAVAAITGETPVVPEPRARKKKPVTPESVIEPHAFVKELIRPMAAKKKTNKPVPTIKKALDKAYEHKSLGEIARSPVHSLQGLTPRHSKMLEEAFGIKTVEDLAGLKYFELARAITVLARYEE